MDIKALVEYASALPNVVVSKDYPFACSQPGQQMIKDGIKENGLNRVIIASCSPRMHEATFQKTVKEAGLNPYLLEMANIREHCSWPHEMNPKEATEKAKDLVRMSIMRANLLESLEPIQIETLRSVLIIGGGIAGIGAALKLADAGLNVYLVERKPTIGGHMAQLDKVFPTLDCAACILTPMMVDVSRHPNVELLTYSEVEGVEGHIGNFKVKVRRKPRYIDEEKCTGCGECAEACLLKGKISNEFDMGLGKRGAAYIPFLQAVPLKYVVDPDHCLYLTRGVCGKKRGNEGKSACEEACQRNAIDFRQKEEIIELEVGAIIAATGYDQYDASAMKEYGYGRYENVITGLELERITSPSGPFMGKILRPSDKKQPRSVAFITCVGSRDERTDIPKYCCRYGCIAAVKHAYLLKSKFGEGVDVHVCYIDLRTFGKGHDELYLKTREIGVKFIRGRPSDITELPDGSLYFDVFDAVANMTLGINVDMVVLMAGLVPSEGARELARILKIPVGPDGFFTELHPKLKPVETVTDGIYVAGVAQGSKDITDTIAHAGNAAAAVGSLLTGVAEIPPIIAVVDEEACSGCAICIATCEYGAIALEEVKAPEVVKRVAKVTSAKCKGCGSCAAACPSNAIRINHFTDRQMLAMVRATFL